MLTLEGEVNIDLMKKIITKEAYITLSREPKF